MPAESALLVTDTADSSASDEPTSSRHWSWHRFSLLPISALIGGAMIAAAIKYGGLSSASTVAVGGIVSKAANGSKVDSGYSASTTDEAMLEAHQCLENKWAAIMQRVKSECSFKPLRYTVTGIMLDISRGHWGTDQERGYDKYLHRFRRNLNAWSIQDDLGGVMLLDEGAAKAAKEEMANTASEQASRWCIIELTLEQMPTPACLHDQVVDAMEQQKKIAPHNLPTVLLMKKLGEFHHTRYVEILQDKAHLFLQTGKLNPFQSDAIGLVDLGTHAINFRTEVEKNGPLKFHTCGEDGGKICAPLVQCERFQKMHDIYAKHILAISTEGHNVLSGAAITGAPKTCARALPVYTSSIFKHLAEGYVCFDQPYWVDVGLHHPDLIEFIDTGSWPNASRYIAFSTKFPLKECKIH